LLPGLRRRPQIEVGIEDDLSVEERPRSSQEEETFLEGEFGKNNIPIAIPLFSDEIFKKIPKEPSSDKKDISVKFGQFDVVIPGRREENKIEDNIIKDYNDDFPVEYQYDYGSDEDLIANYDIGRVTVKAPSTEEPYEVTGKVESSNIASSGEESTSDGRTTKPEVTVTAEPAATSTSEKLESFVPAATTRRVPAKEELTANKLDTNKKVNSVKLGEKKKSIGGVAANAAGGEKGPQIAATETPRVAKEGADETAEQGEEADKKGVPDEESTATEAKNDPNATDDSNTIVENVEEVLPKSLTRGQLTVATTEKSETDEIQTEFPALKTTAPFSRFKPTVSAATNRAVSEIDEKSSVTIPSVFRFLPTLSSGRRDRPSLRERAKALRAITTLSQALRTSTQSTSAVSLSHQKKSTPSPEVPISPTPLSQPPAQLKATEARLEPDKSNEADEPRRRDTQERGLKGDASASELGAPLLPDPIGAVWEAKQPDGNQLSSKPNAATSGEIDGEQLSKAQLQEKLRLLQEKLAKLATDAEVLTKRPTQSAESTTQSSSSLVTGPIRVVKVTTPPPTMLSSQQQPTRGPTTQVKATTLPGQEETKFPNFPTSDVQDELRAAVEIYYLTDQAGLSNLGSFVIWSDSPRVVAPPTRPSPVFTPSRRLAKVN
jgi:hypothetical protein